MRAGAGERGSCCYMNVKNPTSNETILGVGHLTLEGEGWMISGQQAVFFPATWWAGYFFSF